MEEEDRCSQTPLVLAACQGGEVLGALPRLCSILDATADFSLLGAVWTANSPCWPIRLFLGLLAFHGCSKGHRRDHRGTCRLLTPIFTAQHV